MLHCFALNTELQRILNDEPTEEEKKQHEIEKAYRDEQKAVDDEHFAITFVPDSSEASRVRATLIQEQRKDPFLGVIIDKLLTAEAVGKQLAQKQSDDTVQAILEWKRGKISPLSDFCDQPLHRRHGRQRH